MTTLTPAFLATGTAACRVDPDLFFSTARPNERAAVQICTGCPLITACRANALATGERWGTWGGLTANDRHRILSPDDGTWLDQAGRVRRPCGTPTALSAHHSYGETCGACQAAHDARVEVQRRAQLAQEHKAGGSVRGVAIHRRLGEDVCGWCRAAVARQSAERRAARQAGAQRHRGAVAA